MIKKNRSLSSHLLCKWSSLDRALKDLIPQRRCLKDSRKVLQLNTNAAGPTEVGLPSSSSVYSLRRFDVTSLSERCLLRQPWGQEEDRMCGSCDVTQEEQSLQEECVTAKSAVSLGGIGTALRICFPCPSPHCRTAQETVLFLQDHGSHR
ncbi:hypothetical protein GN956_G22043 [Arapaima gigas]